MITSHTPETLRAFEQDIAEIFNSGAIRAPIHLDGGNEQQLIDIFQDIAPDDWVCGSWRQHYHCLLKGVPEAELKAEILAGRSISLCFPAQRVISSAIVGGIVPIALGLAWAIKRRGGSEKVWLFLGDMTAGTGIAMEALRYSAGHDMPVEFVVEYNGKSVCTDTDAVWGDWRRAANLHGYRYNLPWPHSGAGVRVQF